MVCSCTLGPEKCFDQSGFLTLRSLTSTKTWSSHVITTNGAPSICWYKYCSFWVDHFSQLVYATMHVTNKSEEPIHSKQEFEVFASRNGTSIKNIRDGNGVYASKLFQDSCMHRHQKSTFWVVGAHWQNGIAEHFIGNIIQPARAILLHAISKWPDVTAKDMRPFVIQPMMVIDFCNASIRWDKNTTPFKLFTGDWMTSMFLDALHLF